MTDLVAAARGLLGADARPLEGGYNGETFAVEAGGEQAVLRLYLREPGRAGIDAALLRLVRNLIPVPRVLDSRAVPGDDGPAYVLTERLPGVRLDEFLAIETDAGRLERAGLDAGRILSRLSGVPFLTAGEFTGPDLQVRPWPAHAAGLPEWVEGNRSRGRLASWTADEIAELGRIALDAQAMLDTLDRVCLCHSDFNPKNLLADTATGKIIGLVDWEYAHAGYPHADLGNLLRFETSDPFCRAALASYRRHAPHAELPYDQQTPTPLDFGRAADLFALVDLAARERQNDITELANRLLRTTVSEGTLAAGRPDWGGWA